MNTQMLNRRDALRGASLLGIVGITGCLQIGSLFTRKDPAPEDVIDRTVTAALTDDRSWAQVHQSDVVYPLVEANERPNGYRVRVEYVIRYIDDQTPATVEANANQTALLVFRRLYQRDISVQYAFAIGHLRADPTPEYEDLKNPSERPPAIHLVEMSQETATHVDWSTIAPGDLPEVADSYTFDPHIFTPPTAGPRANRQEENTKK